MKNKQNNDILAIMPDARMLARYDEQVRLAEDALVSIHSELEKAGYEPNELMTMAAAFTPGWVEDYEVRRLDGVDDRVRPLLVDMAKKKAAPLSATINEMAKVIKQAGFECDGAHYAINLKPTDFHQMKVKPEHRQSFIVANTRYLDDQERRVYDELADIIPRLQHIKQDGWNIVPLVVGRVGRLDFEKGVPGTEHLAEDVVKYKRTFLSTK